MLRVLCFTEFLITELYGISIVAFCELLFATTKNPCIDGICPGTPPIPAVDFGAETYCPAVPSTPVCVAQSSCEPVLYKYTVPSVSDPKVNLLISMAAV